MPDEKIERLIVELVNALAERGLVDRARLASMIAGPLVYVYDACSKRIEPRLVAALLSNAPVVIKCGYYARVKKLVSRLRGSGVPAEYTSIGEGEAVVYIPGEHDDAVERLKSGGYVVTITV